MSLKFQQMINLDDYETLMNFHLGRIRFQVGNWFRLNGVKGRIYSVDTIKKVLDCVYVSDFNKHPYFNRSYDIKDDKRVILEPFLEQRILISGTVLKIEQGIFLVENPCFSWGEQISDHIWVNPQSSHLTKIIKVGQSINFFATVKKYKKEDYMNRLRYGLYDMSFTK
jgi:hypothetical protein